MEVKRIEEHFRPKGTQEILTQILNCYSFNEQITSERKRLKALAEEAIQTGNWGNVEEVIAKLTTEYEKVKPLLLTAGFIK